MKELKKLFAAIMLASLIAALACFMFGCSSATTTSTSTESAESTSSAVSDTEPYETNLVSVAWLQNNQDDVVIVDARDADLYSAKHIPGAVNLSWQAISNVTDVEMGEKGWAEILSGKKIAAAAAKVGIDGSKPVVLYTNTKNGWGEDGRVMWELKEIGITDIYLLDGGWGAWTVNNGDIISSKDEGTTPTAVTAVEVTDSDPIEQVDTAYVKKNMDSIKLVDCRAEEEYDGQTTMGEAREGHIPNAINVPYLSTLNDDATTLSDEDLQALFTDAGLSESDEIVTYCTGGVRAAAVAELFEKEGYDNVKVYTAGYAEWAGNSNNKIEK